MGMIHTIVVKAGLSANVEAPSENGFTRGSKNGIPAGSIKEARLQHDTTNITASEFQKVGKLQLWNNPDSTTETPGEVTIGSYGGLLNLQAPCDWVDVTSNLQGYQVVFVGWDTQLSSGTALATADVETTWELKLYESYKVTSIPARQYIANTTSQVFYFATEWLDAKDAEKVRAVLEVLSAAGNFEVQMGYQITNNKDSPGTATAFGSAFTTDGVKYPTGWASPSVNGKRYIRFGFFVRVTSAGNGLGCVSARVEMVRD